MSFLKAVRRKAIIYLCGFCFLAFVIAFVWCTSLLRFKNTVCNIRQKDAKSQSLGTASLLVCWRESPPLGLGSQRNEEGSQAFFSVTDSGGLFAELAGRSETCLSPVSCQVLNLTCLGAQCLLCPVTSGIPQEQKAGPRLLEGQWWHKGMTIRYCRGDQLSFSHPVGVLLDRQPDALSSVPFPLQTVSSKKTELCLNNQRVLSFYETNPYITDVQHIFFQNNQWPVYLQNRLLFMSVKTLQNLALIFFFLSISLMSYFLPTITEPPYSTRASQSILCILMSSGFFESTLGRLLRSSSSVMSVQHLPAPATACGMNLLTNVWISSSLLRQLLLAF